MNARDLIEKLAPLTGRRIRITDADGDVYEQMCASVEYLEPHQRISNQGNVILWNGKLTGEGAPRGFTMMARNAVTVDEYDFGICGTVIDIKVRNSHFPVTIEIVE